MGRNRYRLRQRNPDNETLERLNTIKSTGLREFGQDLRPIYDQIREHVKKAPSEIQRVLLIYVITMFVSSTILSVQ